MSAPADETDDADGERALLALLVRAAEQGGGLRSAAASHDQASIDGALGQVAEQTRALTTEYERGLPSTPWGLAAVPTAILGTVLLALLLPSDAAPFLWVLLFWAVLAGLTVALSVKRRRHLDRIRQRLWRAALGGLDLPQHTAMPAPVRPEPVLRAPGHPGCHGRRREGSRRQARSSQQGLSRSPYQDHETLVRRSSSPPHGCTSGDALTRGQPGLLPTVVSTSQARGTWPR